MRANFIFGNKQKFKSESVSKLDNCRFADYKASTVSFYFVIRDHSEDVLFTGIMRGL